MIKEISLKEYESFNKLTDQILEFENSQRLFNELYDKCLEKMFNDGKIHILRYIPLNWPTRNKVTGTYKGNVLDTNKELDLDFYRFLYKKQGESLIRLDFANENLEIQISKKYDLNDFDSYLEKSKEFDKRDISPRHFKKYSLFLTECFGKPSEIIFSGKTNKKIKY